MSQYINLLGTAFRKQRQLLALDHALMLVGLAIVVMIGLQMFSRQQVAGLRQELASAQGLLKVQSAHTERLKGEGTAKAGSSALDTEIKRFEMELKSARDSISVLESGTLANREGFARYLQAFSRQIVDGLWLTGFSVASTGDVAIQGRVLRPELVPVYIQKLNKEPAMQGREFSTLELRRPLPATAPGGTQINGARVVETPRFLEFALSTGEPAAANAQAQGGAR